MHDVRSTLFIVAICIMAASPAFAGRGHGGHGGWGGGGPRGYATPGPVAGAGLPILAVVGGVMWLVKCRRNATARKIAD